MVETMQLMMCLLVSSTAFYCLGFSNGFEDGKKYMKKRIKKARQHRTHHGGYTLDNE